MIIKGFCDSKFAELEKYLEKTVKTKFELGVALSVEIEGEKVIDIWGGFQDAERQIDWKEDTLCNTFSVSKAMTTVCLLKLIEDEKIKLNERISSYWPEYGVNGKEETTVFHFLTHRAGMFGFQDKLPINDWENWDLFTSLLEQQEPFYKPGEVQGYHALTFGYLVGELIRRVDGRTVGTFFKEEIGDPYEVDFIIGLSDEDIERCANIVISGGRSPLLFKAALKMPEWLLPKKIRPIIKNIKEGDFKKAFFSIGDDDAVNQKSWRKAEIPAANGHATSRGIAKFYSLLANDSEDNFLSIETIENASKIQSSGPDKVLLNMPIKFGLGFMVDNPYSPLGYNPNAFGHSGVGGAVGFADKEKRIGFGFIKNYMHRPGVLFKSANDLTKLLYSKL